MAKRCSRRPAAVQLHGGRRAASSLSIRARRPKTIDMPLGFPPTRRGLTLQWCSVAAFAFVLLPLALAGAGETRPPLRGTEGTKPLAAAESLRTLRTKPGLEV